MPGEEDFLCLRVQLTPGMKAHLIGVRTGGSFQGVHGVLYPFVRLRVGGGPADGRGGGQQGGHRSRHRGDFFEQFGS